MLKKLLRYDFKAIFKFWWIAAVINLLLSVYGGFLQLIDNYNQVLAESLYSLIGISAFMVNCSYVALLIVTLVLLFIRYYQNFFTDEGYLTFTLPVSRSQLLNSKMISGVSVMLLSVVVCLVNLAIKNTIAWWPELAGGGYQNEIDSFTQSIESQGAYFWIYALEAVALAIVLVVLAVLILYFCITFGSMIVKKGKLLLSIVLCYLITNAITSIGLFSLIFWGIGFSFFTTLDPVAEQAPLTALILLGLIFYGGLLSGLLYSLQYGMLDKRLNLS